MHPPDRRAPAAATAAALAAVTAVSLALLARPLAAFGRVLWGPEHPWLHRDFLGAWWLSWARAQPEGIAGWLARQNHPDGALPLPFHVPNPWDALLLGPLVAQAPFPLWWNLLQLGHHLGNLLAATWLCRVAGARADSAAAAGALLAASPLLLHEVAGGRTLSGVAWPGLLALGLLLRGRSVLAGLLLGLQGLCYLYTGLLFGLVALLLRPRWGLLAAGLPLAPYAAWLAPIWSDALDRPPPAGHSALPLAGLLGLDRVPERLRLHPALLAGALGLLGARWRWLLAAALGLLVVLGPYPTWDLGQDTLFVSPLAWLQHGVPGFGRMHHPVRAAFVLLPLLAVGLAHLLDRLPRGLPLLALLLVLPLRRGPELAVGWEPPRDPPGAEAARWLALHADGAVLDLTGWGGEALSLQPLHRRPMDGGLRKAEARPDAQVGRLRVEADRWLAGEQVRAGTIEALRAAGYSHVLVVERRGPIDVAGLEADLGPPVVPGVYAVP